MPWYCFCLNYKGFKGIENPHDKVIAEIKSIFKDDFLDFCMVENESGSMDDEKYFFVNCDNYSNYIHQIKKSSVIYQVLPNTNSPDVIPQNQIDKYKSSSNNDLCDGVHFNGDIVQVDDESFLNGLYGVVTGGNDDTYRVLFQLDSGHFFYDMSGKNIRRVKSVFEFMKFPVVGSCYSRKKIKDKRKTKREGKIFRRLHRASI